MHLHHNDFGQQVRPRITQSRRLLLGTHMAARQDGFLHSIDVFPIAEEAPY
jgi:hypothetical protein